MARAARSPEDPGPPDFQSTIVMPPDGLRKTASMRPRTDTGPCAVGSTVSTSVSMATGCRSAHSLLRKRAFMTARSSAVDASDSASALPGSSSQSSIAARP